MVIKALEHLGRGKQLQMAVLLEKSGVDALTFVFKGACPEKFRTAKKGSSEATEILKKSSAGEFEYEGKEYVVCIRTAD